MRSRVLGWFSAAAVVTCMATLVNVASAGWGSGGGSSGFYSGYGSGGGYTAGYGSSGVYGGSVGGYGSSGYVRPVGPLRRLHTHIHNKIHNHFARRHSYGSSGGYVSHYGSSGGSSGVSYSTVSYGSGGGSYGGSTYAPMSYGSTGSVSYGSTGSVSYGSSGSVSYGSVSYGSAGSMSYGSTGSVIHGSQYMESPIYDSVVPSYDSGTPLGSTSPSASVGHSVAKLSTPSAISSNEIHLVVNLPEDAKMFVNGNPTTSTGKTRHFVSRDLSPNQSYRFALKMVVEQDGKQVEKSKVVVLESGRGEEVTFDLSTEEELVETVLKLNVPEGAKVSLGHNPTKTSGEVRTYRTRQLKAGEAWDDYLVTVTHEGKTKEQTIRLIGGDNLELTFNFEEESNSTDRVAMK